MNYMGGAVFKDRKSTSSTDSPGLKDEGKGGRVHLSWACVSPGTRRSVWMCAHHCLLDV